MINIRVSRISPAVDLGMESDDFEAPAAGFANSAHPIDAEHSV
ncbi:hypothetical protein [Amycolatopsis sp. NPDC051372]